MFESVLVANRGEVACRILRTCKALGLRTVAVCSSADAGAPHTVLADQVVELGAGPPTSNYLDMERVLSAVRASGASAVHPGYGLLSESPAFAEAVVAASRVFVGPSADALRQLGDKVRARELAKSVGLLPPEGTATSIGATDEATLLAEAQRVGFPVLVKASGGGGGIGIESASSPETLIAAVRRASDRAARAFGDARIYLEKWISRAHHIEIQVLRDAEGNTTTLGDRECSVQRRYQKVIEECPAQLPWLGQADGQLRRVLHEKAQALLGAAGYVGIATVELLGDEEGHAYFLEVNPRLQVEHAITEAVYDVDLVKWQLRLAAGEPLAPELLGRVGHGHAIEARLYAEDPARGYLPQPGQLVRLKWPAGTGIRIDSGVTEGAEISPLYDPLLGKIIAHGGDRPEALRRLGRALGELSVQIAGPRGPRTTNLSQLVRAIESAPFVSGVYDTGLLRLLE